MKRVMVKRLAIAAAALVLAGCSTFNVHKGAVIDTQLAASIQPGIDNKASVQKLLGTPSLAGQFTANDWYYVSRDQTQLAFRDPRVTRHKVLHVQFDQAGNVDFDRHDRPRTGVERDPERPSDSDAWAQAQLLRRIVRQYRHRQLGRRPTPLNLAALTTALNASVVATFGLSRRP